MRRPKDFRLSPKTMEGKVVLLTGFTTGIGKETAIYLASLGATMVFIGRNPIHGETIKNEIKDITGNSNLFVLKADMSSVEDLKTCAKEFSRRFDKLDVLISNAGMIGTEYERSADGFEKVFAVNHLAPFLLTNLLLPKLQASDDARVVIVASNAHTKAELNLEDLNTRAGFKGMMQSFKVYANSKLCNILFANELARRLNEAGIDHITANSLHPGVIATDIVRDYSLPIRWLWKLVALSPWQGAQTTIHLASSPAVGNVTGQYFVRNRERPTAENAQDTQTARILWEKSAEMCGLDPDNTWQSAAALIGSKATRKSAAKKKAGGSTKSTAKKTAKSKAKAPAKKTAKKKSGGSAKKTAAKKKSAGKSKAKSKKK